MELRMVFRRCANAAPMTAVVAESLCFGDGGNDLGMFDAVGTSIAMGNGNSEVKEMADFVTDGVDENGIWNACVRLGLIHDDLL